MNITEILVLLLASVINIIWARYISQGKICTGGFQIATIDGTSIIFRKIGGNFTGFLVIRGQFTYETN